MEINLHGVGWGGGMKTRTDILLVRNKFAWGGGDNYEGMKTRTDILLDGNKFAWGGVGWGDMGG